MKKILVLFGFIMIAQLTFAQWDSVKISATQINDSLYMLQGRGGNIGISIGKDGVFMVDDQYAPLTDKIVAKIKELTDQPVKFVFNTHWHGDHSGGNENMDKKGAIIVAHKNVYKRMSTDQFIKAFGRKVKASPKSALPVVTFDKDITFHFNGETIMAFHFHTGAHTDGDAIVYFSNSNVIHMGDTYFNSRYPFIDISSGGTIDGIIKVCDNVLMLADEETVIIPGHGDLSNKKELMEYRAMLMTLRDRVLKQKKAGKTLEEVNVMKLSKDYDEKYGKNFINPDRMIGFIYETLKVGE
jgi:glyoxylase-like metal-dependent hydrolase (beta-lactamase superfamily II)